MPNSPTRTNNSFFFSRRFFPLFWVQFLGAFNDNLYKNAMIMLIAFQLSQSDEQTGLYITLAAGIFILPFFLFSAFAGQIADHFPKSVLIRKIKLAEILIMATGVLGLMSLQLEWLFVSLFLMGTQSAFFGPIKYSILPEVLKEDQLLRGNGWFSGSTFIAILLGTIAGGSGVVLENGTVWVSMAVMAVAIVGYIASLMVPETSQQTASVKIDKNIFRSTWQIIHSCRGYSQSFFSVMAISWFWFIGAVLLSQIPTFVKYTLQANEDVVVAFLTMFSVGIAVGSGLVSKLSKKKVNLTYHPALLLLMSLLLVFSVLVADSIMGQSAVRDSGVLMGLGEFLTLWPESLSLVFMFVLAVVGGAYIVPLYTYLQIKTPQGTRARMIAVNNIVNAFLMVLSSVLIMVGYMFDLTLPAMLLILAVFNVLIAVLFYLKRALYNESESVSE